MIPVLAIIFWDGDKYLVRQDIEGWQGLIESVKQRKRPIYNKARTNVPFYLKREIQMNEPEYNSLPMASKGN